MFERKTPNFDLESLLLEEKKDKPDSLHLFSDDE